MEDILYSLKHSKGRKTERKSMKPRITPHGGQKRGRGTSPDLIPNVLLVCWRLCASLFPLGFPFPTCTTGRFGRLHVQSSIVTVLWIYDSRDFNRDLIQWITESFMGRVSSTVGSKQVLGLTNLNSTL